MKVFHFNGNLLWALRVAIARLMIGRHTAAFNLRVENGSIVLPRLRKVSMCNVVVIGADAAFSMRFDDNEK